MGDEPDLFTFIFVIAILSVRLPVRCTQTGCTQAGNPRKRSNLLKIEIDLFLSGITLALVAKRMKFNSKETKEQSY